MILFRRRFLSVGHPAIKGVHLSWPVPVWTFSKQSSSVFGIRAHSGLIVWLSGAIEVDVDSTHAIY